MIPSQRWFPTNLPARAAWMQNFAAQFAVVGASLGFSATEIAGVNDDNTVFQYVADIKNQLDAFDGAVRQYRTIITEDDIGKPTPQFPANPNFALPKTVATGIFERISKLRDRIMLADGYTDEIGALLGILPSAPDTISPADAKGTVQTFPAATGYTFSAVAGNRGEADSWDVFILRKGATEWTNIGRFTGKSSDVIITPTTPGSPEQFQVRIQLRKNNQNYGQPSDAVYVTVNP